MAHAYTPGLRVSDFTVLEKDRKLPLLGEVLVKPGDKVDHDQVVARTALPGEFSGSTPWGISTFISG